MSFERVGDILPRVLERLHLESAMARIRTIKPEFWADEKLSAAPIMDRLVFLGLISMADDAGRILDNIKVIDAFIFSASSDSALEPLRRLAGIGRVRRGKTASGQRILEIVNWKRHQQISHPNLKSAFPEIVEAVEDTEIPEPLRNGSGGDPAAFRPLPVPVPTTSTNDQQPLRRKRAVLGNPVVSHPSWAANAAAVWTEHIGILAVGRIGHALKPAVDEYGWEAVKPWFIAYCKARPYRKRDGTIHGDTPGDKGEGVKNTAFCSPEEFVKTLNEWRDRTKPMVVR